MKGMIYIHVPFCKSRCIYCDFYSTVSSSDVKAAYVQAVCKELEYRQGEINGMEVQSVYFGGGTPSQLSALDLGRICHSILRNYNLSSAAEITLEANPDDITLGFVKELRSLGINRLSLGVQSFNDRILRFLRRRHDAEQAIQAVNTIYEGGIENISIDLMYGLPVQTFEEWKVNLDVAFSLPIRHLSSYALSVENGTTLAKLLDKGQISAIGEESFLSQYERLIDEALKHGFNHYEISNFAKPGFESCHNSSYWNETPYIGVGPGAHSYDGKSLRRMNRPDLSSYIASPGSPFHEDEHLSLKERFNETVFTALRTANGINIDGLQCNYPFSWCKTLLAQAESHIQARRLELTAENRLKLTRNGLFVSNDIMSDFMLLEEDI